MSQDKNQFGQCISLPWDSEPPNKWRIQFYYSRLPDAVSLGMNLFSAAADATYEGGGFQYENCPEIFLGRRGYGPLRIAWDSNILIDYAQYGSLMWEEDKFDPPVTERRCRGELLALCELMNMWMSRDIRIRMPARQKIDASNRLHPEVRQLRLWQIQRFQAALSCIDLDADIDGNVVPFAALGRKSTNDDWDRSLTEEAIANGCHVFLTGDRKLRKKLAGMAASGFISLFSPVELLGRLSRSGQTLLARTGELLMPDNHKWSHVMDAHERGYLQSLA